MISNCWKPTGLLLSLSVSTATSFCIERMLNNKLIALIATVIPHQRNISIQYMITGEAKVACSAHSDSKVSVSAIIAACFCRDVFVEAKYAEEDEKVISENAFVTTQEKLAALTFIKQIVFCPGKTNYMVKRLLRVLQSELCL